jgi:hypothetical protein
MATVDSRAFDPSDAGRRARYGGMLRRGREGRGLTQREAAVSWAARVEAVPAEHRLPAVIEGPVANGDGGGSVAERYAAILLGAAAEDLDGAEARSTIERLLGLGL